MIQASAEHKKRVTVIFNFTMWGFWSSRSPSWGLLYNFGTLNNGKLSLWRVKDHDFQDQHFEHKSFTQNLKYSVQEDVCCSQIVDWIDRYKGFELIYWDELLIEASSQVHAFNNKIYSLKSICCLEMVSDCRGNTLAAPHLSVQTSETCKLLQDHYMHTFHFDDQYHTYHSVGRAMAPDGQSYVDFGQEKGKSPAFQAQPAFLDKLLLKHPLTFSPIGCKIAVNKGHNVPWSALGLNSSR